MIRVRNYIRGEFLPAPLLNHGMPMLDPEWTWCVTPESSDLPFALVACSYAGGWLVIWRLLSVQPLPGHVVRHWFLEALPKVFENAREKGCVGVLSMFSDAQPVEQRLARLMVRIGGNMVPFKGSIAVSPLL